MQKPIINIDKLFDEEDKEILKSFELDEPIKVFSMKERQLIDLKSRVKDINNAK